MVESSRARRRLRYGIFCLGLVSVGAVLSLRLGGCGRQANQDYEDFVASLMQHSDDESRLALDLMAGEIEWFQEFSELHGLTPTQEARAAGVLAEHLHYVALNRRAFQQRKPAHREIFDAHEVEQRRRRMALVMVLGEELGGAMEVEIGGQEALWTSPWPGRRRPPWPSGGVSQEPHPTPGIPEGAFMVEQKPE